MQIILIGFMSSGKSSLGKQLAHKLNMDFIDIDEAFEERYKYSISDFFDRFGEEKFRELERNILQESLKNENAIIATGGGTACFYDNINLINEKGISIYLKLHPNSIFDRLIHTKKQRPLLKNLTQIELKEFINIQLIKREFYYNQAKIVVKAENIKTKNLIDEINLFQSREF